MRKEHAGREDAELMVDEGTAAAGGRAHSDHARHADRRDMEKKLKLVVVGDSYVGKTSLLFAYTQKKFLESYATTVFDNWAINVSIEQKNYTVNLFDTAGQMACATANSIGGADQSPYELLRRRIPEDYESLRCLSYPNTDVFILCFSLIEKKSLEACRSVWMPEIRKYAGDEVPVVLVGTKEDLWDSTNEKERVSFDSARKAANEMGCVKFLPCSSLTHRGLKRVFDEAFLTGVGIQLADDDDIRPCCSIQ